jgi:hypothetical protein
MDGPLDENAILIIDELSQVGRSDMLKLMELQQKHGFMLLAVGDPKQCQSVESGPTISLLQEALGDAIPEVLISKRQHTEREVKIASLFREGKAADAIAMKREDKTAIAVPGGRQTTIDRVAALWRERIEARGDEPDFKLTISAPTNQDAHVIDLAIRDEMREMGWLSGDERIVTVSMRGERSAQKLALSSGDKVRVFNRVWAEDKQHFASNGDVITILKTSADGLTARNGEGREAFLSWRKFQPEGGPPQLSYGYCLTIDASQGITSDEHIDALPDGSHMTQGLKGYTAESRHHDTTWLVVNEAAERRQIAGRLPVGEYRRICKDDVWRNVAGNLSQQPIKASALEVLSSTLAILRWSCGVAESVCYAISQSAREFLHVRDFAGDRETLRLPDFLAHGGQRIGKGRLLRAIPSSGPDRAAGARRKLLGEQRHQGKQAQQAGRGVGDGFVGPLALALEAEAIAHLAEGDLDRPALHEPTDHAQRVLHRVGAQKRLRLELALRIAQQHPADRGPEGIDVP